MPIYEYACQNCGHHLEALQGINDEPLKECPECGKNKLEKLLSAPKFHLKGTGWYKTDFRDGNKPATAKATKNESSSTDTKTETKETKETTKKPEKTDE